MKTTCPPWEQEGQEIPGRNQRERPEGKTRRYEKKDQRETRKEARRDQRDSETRPPAAAAASWASGLQVFILLVLSIPQRPRLRGSAPL
ncbi:unnamed protein product [Boreogadus saida]